MIARTPHRIANTQQQPVHLSRTRPVVDLLPRRYGVGNMQGTYATSHVTEAFVDSFERADEAIAGSVADSGHVWTQYHPTADANIVGGRMVQFHPGTGAYTSYPGVELRTTATHFGGVINFNGTTGANASCVFIMGNDAAGFAAAGYPKNMIHIVCASGQYVEVTTYIDGVAGPLLISEACPFALNDSANTVDCTVSGDSVQIRGPGGFVEGATDDSISVAAGPMQIYQLYYHDYPTQDYIPRFDSVYASTWH
jgi:hypothetical protein